MRGRVSTHPADTHMGAVLQKDLEGTYLYSGDVATARVSWALLLGIFLVTLDSVAVHLISFPNEDRLGHYFYDFGCV